MAKRGMVPPELKAAGAYRRAREAWDRERIGRYGPAGFGFREGYRGAYAERPEYRTPRGELVPPEPGGSGWPHPIRELSPEELARHQRAYTDRDLARSVVAALYQTIGDVADHVGVRACEGIVVLDGRVRTARQAETALEVARAVPGVRRARSRLEYRE